MKELELRVCQSDALEQLRFHREGGADKALVVMASSLGKTITAIYDIEAFMKNRLNRGRVLVLCHNNSILNDLRAAFEDVLSDGYTYGSFSGVGRCLEKTDFLFATFQSVRLYMNEFEPNEFAYIVVDECHHAKAKTFEEVIRHFEPEFLLGITATPTRTDGKQISDIFGDAVHVVDLVEAISKGLVAAIDYRLMLDDILTIKDFVSNDNQKITLAELNKRIFVPKRDDEIVKLINEKTADRKNPKTIIFCSAIEHAERMANLIPDSTIVHSKIGAQENLDRIGGFKDGRYDTIVSVDMLNEGVDIPKADVIVFLRSTVSPIVYYQQLGRGLRLHAEKDNVLVLDFIANCERIEMIESFKDKVIDSMSKNSTYKPHERMKRFDVNIDKPEFAEIEVDILARIKQARALSGHVWTREEVIAALQRFDKETGETPMCEDCQNYAYLPNATVIYKLFDSFNNALMAAGLKPNRMRDYWNRENCIEVLQRFYQETGKAPTYADCQECDYLPCGDTVKRIFGSFAKAIVEANLQLCPLCVKNYWSVDNCINAIVRFYKETKKVPTKRDCKKCNYLPSPDQLRNVFGSFNKALIAANLEPNHVTRTWTVDACIEALQSFHKETGKIPTTTDLLRCNYLPSWGPIRRLFGSMKNALIAAGLIEKSEVNPKKN